MPQINFHWYGLIAGLAIIVCYDLARKLAKTEKLQKLTDDAFLPVILSGLVGARLYHVLDQFEFYKNSPINIFYLNQGGLGIFGALIGGGLGLLTFLYLTKNLNHLWELLSILVTVLPLGQAVGRFGNFINKELFGTPTNLPWGIDDQFGVARHPLFFYEMVLNLLLFVFLFSKNDKTKNVSFYLVGYGLIRLVLEFFREPSDTWIYLGVPIAKLISLSMIAVGIIILYKNAPKIPNLHSATKEQ